MSFLNGLVGPNPQIDWHYNTFSDHKSLTHIKTKSVALIKTNGSLGTFIVDCMKVAFGALALLAASLIGGPISYILVGGSVLCLYKSIKRYKSGAAGELKAEASVKTKGVSDTVKDMAKATQSAATNTYHKIMDTKKSQ